MSTNPQLAVLGRQPAISLAELESIYGAKRVTPLNDSAAVVHQATNLDQARLGGTMKSAQIIAELSNTDLATAFAYLKNNLSSLFGDLPEGKLKLGISVYDFDIRQEKLLAHTLSLKKALKQTGRSVRIIENKAPTISTAQILYNKLTGALGRELIIIKNGSGAIVAQTTGVQDIDSYSDRDFGRPKRDARVGMLPPKLAQIIINLGVGDQLPANRDSSKPHPPLTSNQAPILLDPFCGTGVVLQEAALMGFDIYGTDLEPRMIEYTDKNLMWLLDQPNCPIKRPDSSKDSPDWRYFKLETADATNHQWKPAPNFIACEAYLGRPFSALPSPEVLQQVVQDVDTITRKFLLNVARQTKPGFKICVALPAWKTPHGFKHLKTLDSLDTLGYTRQVFKHAEHQELIYHRTEQIVARELVVLIRK